MTTDPRARSAEQTGRKPVGTKKKKPPKPVKDKDAEKDFYSVPDIIEGF